MTHARALSSSEFRAAFRQACPPSGWGDRVAIALSGGPDSTALLGLLQSLIKSGDVSTPSSLTAFTVDHGLRPDSADEAALIHSRCSSLGIDHRVLTIPWSVTPYPSRPGSADYETVARRARYHILFQAMVEGDISTLLLAHHVGDQAETAYMRATRMSGKLGLAGMRRCRRFGMGEPSAGLCRFGLQGMRMWMSRPLLDFPKERLIATCQELGLSFVTDPSNLDPSTSLRNRVRELLAKTPDVFHAIGDDPVQNAEGAISHLERPLAAGSPTSPSVDNNRFVLYQMRERSRVRDAFDEQVTELLKRWSVKGPMSTIIISKGEDHAEQEVELGVIARIMRYASPRPWGHRSAEAGRRDSRLRQVWRVVFGVEAVNNLDPFASFQVGSAVLWRHVPGTRKYPCWMAMRAPPRSDGEIHSLHMDLTELVLLARTAGSPPQVVLWDNRFSITFPAPGILVDLLVQDSASLFHIRVEPDRRRYTLPSVILEADGKETILAAMQSDGTVAHDTNMPLVDIRWIRSEESI